jgi:hypothetical protein
MKHVGILGLIFLCLAATSVAADLSTAAPQDLLAIYKQLRAIQGGNSAITENVVLKRDSATFTFTSGRIVFAAPISERVFAARFQGEGKFELDPVSPIDKRQLSRFAKGPKLTDTFREAVFYFTDDTYAELAKLLKIESTPAADKMPFASSQKLYSENFTDWVENQRKGNPTMRNLAARILADITDASSKGFFLADFKGKESGDLLFHISWNRDSLLLPEYSKGEEVALIHVKPGSYYEWWSGFHLSSEYAQSPHPDHRTSIAACPSTMIDMQLKDNSISATAEMEFTASDGVRVLPFNLDGVLRISSITDGEGKPVSFIQEASKLDSDPWVILPEPAKSGQKYKIKLVYKEVSSRDSRIVFNRGAGLYYVTSRESWFPSFGAFDDRTQFELHARSPKKFQFVASGNLIKSEQVKDELVTTWKSELPLSVIGFNYGTFAESVQGGPEFKVTAYAGKEVPNELKEVESLKSVIDLANMGGGPDAELEAMTQKGGFNTAQNAKYAAGMSLQAFKLFEFLFGPLPFKAVSVTEQPVRGYGQSWPNLIFLPYDSLLDATTRHNLKLQESDEDAQFYELVAVHEMAHQWWGHMVGYKTYHDQWLSEGIAEFASGLYLRQFQPKSVNAFWNLKRSWLLSKNRWGYRPVDAGPVYLNTQLGDYEGSNNTRLIYEKGAYVMEMLRILMYDPSQKNPDNRFITMMRDFIKTYAGQNVSTEDFQKVVEKHIGEPMDWFFHEWIYGTAIPSYEFSYKLADAGSGQTEISISVTQSDVPDNFKMKLPVYIAVKDQMQFLGTITAEGTKPIKTSMKTPFRPDNVLLDPGRSVLAGSIRQ